jgi:hypothetical protein
VGSADPGGGSPGFGSARRLLRSPDTLSSECCNSVTGAESPRVLLRCARLIWKACKLLPPTVDRAYYDLGTTTWEVSMRMRPSAIVLTCGVVLLGCNDAAQQSPTEPLPPSFDITTPSPTDESDKAAKKDRVKGAGSVPNLGFTFHVTAHSGPSGEEPTGHLKITLTGMVHEGKVTCLFVLDNRAAVGIDRADDPRFGVFLVVEDNGEGGPVPDRATFASGPSANESGCRIAFAVFAEGFASPVEGDVVVEDAPPPVTP